MIHFPGHRLALLLLLASGTAAAQTPATKPADSFVEPPAPAVGSERLPPPTAEVPIPVAPPILDEAVPYPFSPPVPSGTAIVYDDTRKHQKFHQPLPGSLDDAFTRDYVGREGFRFCHYGTAVTLFPTTLFWEPPLAIFREPRFALYAGSDSGFQNFGIDTVDTSIGVIPGILRIEPPGSDLAYQIDLFGVVHTRWDGDDAVATSYRFGIPLTFRRGPWAAKLSYETTTDTLGNRFQYAGLGVAPTAAVPFVPGITPPPPTTPRWRRDEIVFGLGRLIEEQLRLYGQIAYAAQLDWPGTDIDRTRYDLGFEWYHRCPTGFAGTPFLAANFNFDGVTDYEAGYTVQAGWLWRNPELRLAQGRVFLQYANGRSMFAPFAANREDTIAFGIAGDY